jgi:two-component system, sensor histidine kinase PdtaS
VDQDEKGWIAARFARLSTGLKMLLILSIGLLPLGIIAILASVDSARDNRSRGEVEARAALMVGAQRLSSALQRSSITIEAASDALADTLPGAGTCQRLLARLQQLHPSPARYALYADNNEFRCATPGFTPPPLPAGPAPGRALVELTNGDSTLRFTLFDEGGEIAGVGEFDREALVDLAAPPEMRGGGFDLWLAQGERRMMLRDAYRDAPFAREVALSQTLADGRIELHIRAPAQPITPAELLMILLPVMMWLAAAMIGWLIVDRLLLRPLGRMQKVISAYQPGDRALDLPTLRSPAREIGELGQAFDRVTQTVARHEADLEAAVERQTRLVREVHHRVKNNLQVVASLLNLHSRGSANEDVAAAYASIQRRVDALAVVHRNHYAELEENRGVALKSLIAELCANLRATAPASAAHMQIRLDVEPFYATQDIAVSVAFLVTEIVEFSMLCGAQTVSVALEGANSASARLSVESESLIGPVQCEESLFERFDRIITGLARQLRSTLERAPEAGRYSVSIAVIDKAER